MSDAEIRVRIDKWLWAARFFKTRSLAAQAIEAGKVTLNDERVKPAKALAIGDRLVIRIELYEWSITVRTLAQRRGPPTGARELYTEDDASRERRMAAMAKRREGVDPVPEHGGRPDKKQRRILQRLRGH
jgi:ribosome-associated heat shock protein Hsp15